VKTGSYSFNPADWKNVSEDLGHFEWETPWVFGVPPASSETPQIGQTSHRDGGGSIPMGPGL